MPLTDAGAELISALLVGAGVPLDNAHGCIGVGDSTTAFDQGQTDLQASTNKIRKGMDVSFPTIAGNVIEMQATFAPSEANWDWREWATFNNPSGGTMLSRVQDSTMGTKLATQSWHFSVTLTVYLA
jgi:hypothetical protein